MLSAIEGSKIRDTDWGIQAGYQGDLAITYIVLVNMYEWKLDKTDLTNSDRVKIWKLEIQFPETLCVEVKKKRKKKSWKES